MQETGPIPPTDDQPSAADAGANATDAFSEHVDDAAPTSEPESKSDRAAQPPRSGGDPLVRWLLIAIFGVVILTLAGVVSALVFGLFNTTGAPRTEVERELVYLSAQVQSGKANSQSFALYVDALVRAGQLAKAKQALDTALQTAKTDRSYLLAEQAKLNLTDKQYQATVKSADLAMAEAQKELKAYVAKNIAANRAPYAGAVIPDSYSTAALAKASALAALHDYAGAIKAYDAYLKISSTDSDVLVLRAQLKVQTGDKTGAAADYRTALKYIPDYQPALDGLKQIGASK